MGFYLKKQKVGFITSWESAEQKITSCRNGRRGEFATPFLLRREGEGCLLKDYFWLPSALHEHIHRLVAPLVLLLYTKPQRSRRSHRPARHVDPADSRGEQKHPCPLPGGLLGWGSAEAPGSRFPTPRGAPGSGALGSENPQPQPRSRAWSSDEPEPGAR